MKKLLAMLLAVSMLFALAACGEKPTDETPADDTVIEIETENTENEKAPANEEAQKPAEDKKEDDKKEDVAQKPADAPEKAPDEKPDEAAKTVGNILLADFKAKAGSATSALSLAEGLIGNSIIPFMGGAMEVEPGLLSGFDNAEIKGFKEGATFMPMIGSYPFVGYVFFLEDGVNVNDFIANLKANANLRWNICVEADEMVAGNVGNKVFFVMCPKEFEAE